MPEPNEKTLKAMSEETETFGNADALMKGLEEQPQEITKDRLIHSDLNKTKEYVGMSDQPIDAVLAGTGCMADLGIAFYEAEENDGKIDIKDAGIFTPVIMEIGSTIIGGKLKNFGAQVTDIDDVERQTLYNAFLAKVGATSMTKELQEFVDACYAELLGLASVVYKWKAYKASLPPTNA